MFAFRKFVGRGKGYDMSSFLGGLSDVFHSWMRGNLNRRISVAPLLLLSSVRYIVGVLPVRNKPDRRAMRDLLRTWQMRPWSCSLSQLAGDPSHPHLGP